MISAPRLGILVSTVVALTFAGASASADTCAEPDKDCLPPPSGLESMVPDLNVLKTPPSPALALVGGAPLDIERPTTPTGAAASLASGIAHGLLVPGTVTAVQVTPYWLMQHPLLTARKTEDSRAWSLIRDLTVSFAAAPGVDPARPASATTMTASTPNASLISLGVRTTIWPGELSPAAKSCVARIDAFMKGDVEARAPEEEAFVVAWAKSHPKPPPRVEVDQPAVLTPASALEWKKQMDAANAANPEIAKQNDEHILAFNAALQEWVSGWRAAHAVPSDVVACSSIIHHRIGWMVSVAGAGLLSAADQDFKRLHQGGTRGVTAWLTGGYTHAFEGNTSWDLSLFGALRLRHQKVIDQPATTKATDYGARVVAAFTRWGLSAQAMRVGPGANGFGSQSAWQGGVAVDYHLQSGYWLTLTAASSDLGNVTSFSTATTLVHLQYNVGRDRLVQPDTSPTRPQPAAEVSQ